MFLVVLVALAASAANAQSSRILEKAEPPPPPEMEKEVPVDEPQVTIRKRGDDTVREFRLNGRLYMMEVTPAVGPPYYLIDERGDGEFTRRDTLEGGLIVPRWVIKSW